ncbi:MAG: acetate--CoA ligase family protein [Anaerolineales bacterium]
MKLHEYQSKKLFAEFGVPIPKGEVATTPAEAKAIAKELGGRVVVKSQVLVGGRGKAGGIKLASSPEEAETLAEHILGLEIKGLPVRKVLIDEAADIQKEIYLGITNDRAAKKPVFMASAAGGVDIEEVAAKTPEKIIRIHIDPLLGLQDFQVLNLAVGIEIPREQWGQFNKVAHGLWQSYKNYDATLAEINPLIITGDGALIAVDGKMIVDDNALFRHQDLEAHRDLDVEESSETEAKAHGLTYIKLDGEIGCMVNGAGLAMATMEGR